MTNREWLNSLSDDELAKYLSIVADYGNAFFPNELFITYQTANRNMEYQHAPDFTGWLKAEKEDIN